MDPLEAIYPVIYLDALVVKVRDQGVAQNKSAYIAIGVKLEGASLARLYDTRIRERVCWPNEKPEPLSRAENRSLYKLCPRETSSSS